MIWSLAILEITDLLYMTKTTFIRSGVLCNERGSQERAACAQLCAVLNTGRGRTEGSRDYNMELYEVSQSVNESIRGTAWCDHIANLELYREETLIPQKDKSKILVKGNAYCKSEEKPPRKNSQVFCFFFPLALL